jgi:hypothetical protein
MKIPYKGGFPLWQTNQLTSLETLLKTSGKLKDSGHQSDGPITVHVAGEISKDVVVHLKVGI